MPSVLSWFGLSIFMICVSEALVETVLGELVLTLTQWENLDNEKLAVRAGSPT